MKPTPSRTLPLGIDVGEARIRVALAQCRFDGTAELVAVATRPRGEDLASSVAEAVAELRTRERRCVFGVAEPAAILRAARFPAMRRPELESAARFEASRLVDYAIDEAVIRVVPLETGRGESAIGIVRKDAIARLRALARSAKLRIIAVDNSGFALRRAVPDADAVLDIGLSGARFYVFGPGVPRAHRWQIGGASFTQAIVGAFGTDEFTAERRKLSHGIAGSGEPLRDRLVDSIANALVDCRSSGYGDVRRVALVGNGARLDDLAAIIERATAVRVALATLAPSVSQTLPPDVLRVAAPDWCQAYGLALWTAA